MNIKLNNEPYSVSDIHRLTGSSRTVIYQWIQAFGQKEFNVACIEQGKAKKYPATLWKKALEQQSGHHVSMTVETPTYADPFTGLGTGGALVPIDYQATDRSAAVATLTGQISDLCQASAANTQNLTHQLLVNGQNLGDQLGAALGAQIIQSAESRKNAMVGEYLRSQGVTTAPKPQSAA